MNFLHIFAGQLNHVFKIVIAGNHECTFDDRFMKATGESVIYISTNEMIEI